MPTRPSFVPVTNAPFDSSPVRRFLRALSSTGVDLAAVFDDLDTRRPHKVIGESFREFERYEAFGVPTFVVNGDATFVRYMTVPSEDEAASVALIDSLLTLMSVQSDLNEFKHTKVPM